MRIRVRRRRDLTWPAPHLQTAEQTLAQIDHRARQHVAQNARRR